MSKRSSSPPNQSPAPISAFIICIGIFAWGICGFALNLTVGTDWDPALAWFKPQSPAVMMIALAGMHLLNKRYKIVSAGMYGFYAAALMFACLLSLGKAALNRSRKAIENQTALRTERISERIEAAFKVLRFDAKQLASKTAGYSASEAGDWRQEAASYLMQVPGVLRIVAKDAIGRIAWGIDSQDVLLPSADFSSMPAWEHAPGLATADAAVFIRQAGYVRPQLFAQASIPPENSGAWAGGGALLLVLDLERFLSHNVQLSKYQMIVKSEDSILFATPDKNVRETLPEWTVNTAVAHDAGKLTLQVAPNPLTIEENHGLVAKFLAVAMPAAALLIGVLVQLVAHMRIQSRKAIRDQKFSASVANLLPNVVYIIDLKENAVVYTNRSPANICMSTLASGAARSPDYWMEMIHPDDRKKRRESLAELRTKKDGEVIEVVRRVLHDNGVYRWIATRETVFKRDTDGSVAQVIGVAEDVTDRKNQEDEVNEINQRLTAATKAKSRFLANVSHEIRTPLSGIVGLTDLMLDADLEPGQREYAQSIRDAAGMLSAIINDLLDMARIEAGKLELNPTAFNPRTLVDSVARSLTASASKKQLDFRVNPCPSGEEKLNLLGDPTRIGQILSNLIHNAIKFTEHGHVTVSLRTTRIDHGVAELQISISDSGVGLDTDAAARLFHPFVQAASAHQRHAEGMGLGLSICKNLVDLMGGKIGVRSKPASGSVFWFSIPLPITASVEFEAVHSSMQDIKVGSLLSKPSAENRVVRARRILLAEDNPLLQRTACLLLQKEGYEVTAVGSGLEAMSALESARYDAVVMDCHMPGMDGFQATQNIRKGSQAGRHIPIIALTASALQSEKQECIAAGMNAVVTKPFKISDLVDAIEDARNRAGQETA